MLYRPKPTILKLVIKNIKIKAFNALKNHHLIHTINIDVLFYFFNA